MSHDTPHLPVYPSDEQPRIEQDAASAQTTPHVYHTYTMAGLRLVLDVEVAAGTALEFSQRILWGGLGSAASCGQA